jgi:hypothetical protein
MMRFARLGLVILVLTATTALSAAPVKGGTSVRHRAPGATTSGEFGFICYGTGQSYDCGDLSSCACLAACGVQCGGPCDWDGSCIAD